MYVAALQLVGCSCVCADAQQLLPGRCVCAAACLTWALAPALQIPALLTGALSWGQLTEARGRDSYWAKGEVDWQAFWAKGRQKAIVHTWSAALTRQSAVPEGWNEQQAELGCL